MRPLLTTIAQSTTSTTTGSKSSSSSSWFFLVIIVVFALGYFFFIRPRQQRMRQQAATGRQFAVGDEVVSAGGIHGRVISVGEDSADVEVADGVVLTFTRRALSPRPGGSGSSASHLDEGSGDDEEYEDGPDGTGVAEGPDPTGDEHDGDPPASGPAVG